VKLAIGWMQKDSIQLILELNLKDPATISLHNILPIKLNLLNQVAKNIRITNIIYVKLILITVIQVMDSLNILPLLIVVAKIMDLMLSKIEENVNLLLDLHLDSHLSIVVPLIIHINILNVENVNLLDLVPLIY